MYSIHDLPYQIHRNTLLRLNPDISKSRLDYSNSLASSASYLRKNNKMVEHLR